MSAVLSGWRRRPAQDAVLATDLLRLRALAGAELGDVRTLPARTRRALAVATEAGAPVSDALDGAAAAEADVRRAQRAVTVASAQTRAVAGGLLLAPIVLTPALGRLVGADLVGFYTSPPGLLVAAIAAVLYGLGAGLVAGLVRRIGRVQTAGPRPRWLLALLVSAAAWLLFHPVVGIVAGLVILRRTTPGDHAIGVDEAADLTATALAGGVSVPAALRTAAGHLPGLADRLHRLAFDLELGLATAPKPAGLPPASSTPTPAFERLSTVLSTAVAMGAPVAPSLRRLARDLRADDLAQVLAATERLPAQLTFPTALCLLPATILTVGAPIVVTGLASVGT